MLNPVSVSDPFQNAFGILTQVARDRGRVYRWLALGFYAPDNELVTALQEGTLKGELTQATAWLGMDQRPLLDSLDEMNAHATASLPELQDAYEALFGKSVSRIAARESAYLWRSVTHPADAAGELNQASSTSTGSTDSSHKRARKTACPCNWNFWRISASWRHRHGRQGLPRPPASCAARNERF